MTKENNNDYTIQSKSIDHLLSTCFIKHKAGDGALKRATCGVVGRPTTAGIDVPERLAQVPYPAIAWESEAGTLSNDSDRPNPVQRQPGYSYIQGDPTWCNQPFLDNMKSTNNLQ
jgi:hypothetical protein